MADANNDSTQPGSAAGAESPAGAGAGATGATGETQFVVATVPFSTRELAEKRRLPK